MILLLCHSDEACQAKTNFNKKKKRAMTSVVSWCYFLLFIIIFMYTHTHTHTHTPQHNTTQQVFTAGCNFVIL